MNNNLKFWDNIYEKMKEKKPSYDLWIDKYEEILNKVKDTRIIDLGCGIGCDSLYLTERGYNVVACDYSIEALNIVNKFMPEIETMEVDISKALPFEDNSTQLIIADLSLHYFNDEITKSIAKEIKRILKPNGYLIGRVNSVNDLNYGAGSGQEIEKNYYLTKEGYKRFFNEEDIRYYFKEFNLEYCKEESVLKYGNEKKAWEFVVIEV